jgi:hypothetical protein
MPNSAQQSRQKARREFWKEHEKHEYNCPDCGREIGEIRHTFEVHHKDGDPENNDMDNLVGLCRPCHNIREGKKPSINDWKHVLGKETGQSSYRIPLIKTVEQENNHFAECDESSVPVLEVIQKNRRKYCSVQIDFTSTGGWQEFRRIEQSKDRRGRSHYEEGKHIREPHAQLTEQAVRTVNSIVTEYRDCQQPANHNVAFRTSHGFDYTRFPPLKVDKSMELADRIKPVVLDRSNWEARNAGAGEVLAPVYE